ncbi:alkaline phosphatase PafA [Compostibacter hankyongensis]|uniref:Alkaline phosphatase family protein n=1 Tax=Compostibacter hankyongensis TaxID=1007089 RepID=A0ABP8GBQ4_9BACT
MLKRNFTLALLLTAGMILMGLSLKAQSSRTLPRPRLVVGIVVDQMRWDYLYRYYDRYGEGGFKRLLNEGFSCENTFISHLPSFTAVGHTTVFTGSVPAIHGITGNDWTDQLTGRKWYCTEDTAVQSVGTTGKVGEMSPRNLLASTITDELRMSTNFRSKVVGVSLKDRAAILPAGHMPNGAFWLDDASGKFITSSYYMQELPDWAQQFNARKEPEKLVAGGWKTLYPINTYIQSTADNVSWEGTLAGEEAPVFPHDLKDSYQKDRGSLRISPFGNTLTLDFARAAVEGYDLGRGPVTDFLTINCASTDYVGHKFGPKSIEVEDTYLRLDKDLEKFFSYLDQRLGKGNYLVFLTADHGASESVGYLEAHNVPSGLFNSGGITKSLNKLLEQQYGVAGLVRSAMNYQINFDLNKIAEHKLDIEKIKKTSLGFLRAQPGVQFALDMDHIGESSVPEPIRMMAENGYNAKRSGQIQLIPEPGWYSGSAKGTTHGTWAPYDTHIPLVFMGWGIRHGATNETVHMTDIAPTVAALLHIQMPGGCVGKVVNLR